MFDFDKWQEIFATIKRHKLRTTLTAFGVFWGILMLILLMGFGNALQHGVEADFKDDAINSIWVFPGETTLPYKGMPIGRRIRMNIDDYDAIEQQIDGIEHSSPRNGVWGQFLVSYKNNAINFDIRATYPDYKYIENTMLTEGRFVNEEDINKKRPIACIGVDVVKGLYPDGENPIGTFINIKNVPFKVVGVFDDEGSERERQKIYIPWSYANQAFNFQNRVYQMMVTTGDASVEESVVIANNMKNKLAERHKFDPNDQRAVYVRNLNEQFQEIMGLFSAIKMVVWFVGIGTLIAGVIGVGNIMLVIVKERTREIGVRKALGATPYAVVSLILQEAIFITAIAGYLGLVAGIGLLEVVNSLIGPEGAGMFRNPSIDLYLAIFATLILVLGGAIAGILPAIRAAQINPIDALRDG
ncbi:MAG: ABC transporter permease [Chitinophagales bacterium]